MDTTCTELASGLTRGRLEGVSVPELLWDLSRAERTGVLRVTRATVTKTLYLDRGRVVFAASSDPDDRLGVTLLRDDVITLDQLRRASSRYGGGKRLGTLLVEIAAITPQDLVNGVLAQVQEIIMSLFPLEDGEYRFDEGDLPTDEVITVNMKMEELLLQGIRQVRSFTRIRSSVGPPRTRYRRTDSAEAIAERLVLSEGERTLLSHLDDRGTTVEDLCRRVFLSNFEIYQALWAFSVLGAVEEVERAASASERAAVEGHLGTEGIGNLLVRLCREGETGVLHVSRGAVDRSFHLLEGRLVFATSNNIDDGLIAHLLRRGVISLEDREETARRLLSNKRVGTILREMGVIDDRDLHDMVREQLGEVVYDTFRWDGGEYAFVPGELPTFEEITLDLSIEDIVAEGVRRVTSWTRIQDGCGGLDAAQTLAPGYLETLDRMNIGQDEWEVVAALRTPRSAAELCGEIDLGDFRVCQLLWTLRLLGVVRAAEALPEVEAETEVPEASSPPALVAAGITEPDPAPAGVAGGEDVRESPAEDPGDGDRLEPAPPELPEVDTATSPGWEPAGAPTGDDRSPWPPEGPALELDEPPPALAGSPESDADTAREPDVEPSPWRIDSPGVSGEAVVEPPSPSPPFELESVESVREVDTFTDLPHPGPACETEDGWDEEERSIQAWDVESAEEVAAGARHDAPATETGDLDAPEPVPFDAGIDTPGSSVAEDLPPDEPLEAAPTEPEDANAEAHGGFDDPRSEKDSGGTEAPEDVDLRDAADRGPVVDLTASTRASSVEASPALADNDAVSETGAPGPDDRDAVAEADSSVRAGSDDSGSPGQDTPEIARDADDARTADLPRHEVEALLDAEERARAVGDATGIEAGTEADRPDDQPVERTGAGEPACADDLPADAHPAALGGESGNGRNEWDPPENLESLIARFNAMQRMIYRSIRSEVGAGAANFVRSCGGSLEDRFGRVFASVELQADGAWDPNGLRAALVEERIEEPWYGLQQLIDEEIDKLRIHIGEARAAGLQDRLASVEG